MFNINIKSVIVPHTVAVVISLAVTSGIIFNQIPAISEAIAEEVKDKVLSDFYRDLEFNLAKQGEKLNKDAPDLKKTDLERFTYHCGSSFGVEYIPTLPSNRKLVAKQLCSKVEDFYLEMLTAEMSS